MTLTLSKRDILVLISGLLIGFLLGTGTGAVVAGGNLPAEIVTGLISLGLIIIGGVGTIVKLLIDRISEDLRHNTNLTNQALGAATDAANHASERAGLIDRLQREELRAEAAERVIGIIEGNPACISCRHAIGSTIDQWRTIRQGGANEPG